jgi:hypothetical protein
VLKEYWNTVARSQEWLVLTKGVKSVSISNKKAEKISKENIQKFKIFGPFKQRCSRLNGEECSVG